MVAGHGWNRRRFIATAGAGMAAAGAGLETAGASTGSGTLPHAGPGRRARPLYLGTYTTGSGSGTGIGLAWYEPRTGGITGTGVVPLDNPSFLALSPTGRTLYAVDEQPNGTVTALAVARDGSLRVLGAQPTGGDGPTHLSVHPCGRFLLTANYDSGSVAVHPVGPDGSLGERTDLVRHTWPPPGPGQEGPHAHQIVTSPDGGHVLAVDLGNDTVYTYRLDLRSGRLERVSYATLRPGAGPRHLAFHPGGAFAYLANEVDDTIVVCAYDRGTGRLTPGTPQSTGTGTGRNYPAEVLVTADGTMAYLANRGHNTISRYAIESGGAGLRLLDSVPVGGDFPRHIAFDPAQRLLFAANQKSGSVTVFSVDRGTGGLTPVQPPFAAPVPVCVLPV